MRAKKKQTWPIQVLIYFFFIFFTASGFGAENEHSGNSNHKQKNVPKTNKIRTEQPPEIKSEPQAETQAKTIPTRPKEIVFVLDNSGSMKQNDPNRITKDVVTSFIKNVDAGSRLGMVIFGKDARILEPLTEITGTPADAKFIDSLNRLDYRGQLTNTPTGIERAIYELKTNGKENADKVIILLTDGIIDTGDVKRNVESERWLKEGLVPECQQLGIKIFGIAFTDNADFRLMQILSSKTNGEYFRVYQAEEIQNVFNNINKQLSRPSLAEPDPKTATSQTGKPVRSEPPQKEKTKVEQQLGADSKLSPQKMPTLRTEPSKPDRTVSETDVSPGKRSTNTFLTLFLIAITLAVFILLLIIFKNSRGKTSDLAFRGNRNDMSPEIRPDVQAELIDVEHIIPQDSISLTIDKASVSIGRGSNNDIVVPEKVISSLHATISYKNGQYYLEDNRSTNGTRLNNKLIEQNTKVTLKSGDIIHFAKYEFRFLVHDQAPYGETMMIDAQDIS